MPLKVPLKVPQNQRNILLNEMWYTQNNSVSPRIWPNRHLNPYKDRAFVKIYTDDVDTYAYGKDNEDYEIKQYLR